MFLFSAGGASSDGYINLNVICITKKLNLTYGECFRTGAWTQWTEQWSAHGPLRYSSGDNVPIKGSYRWTWAQKRVRSSASLETHHRADAPQTSSGWAANFLFSLLLNWEEIKGFICVALLELFKCYRTNESNIKSSERVWHQRGCGH